MMTPYTEKPKEIDYGGLSVEDDVRELTNLWLAIAKENAQARIRGYYLFSENSLRALISSIVQDTLVTSKAGE